jgi:hypothetical protein
MITKEAKFQTVFNQYLRQTKMQGHFELKQAIGNSLPYSKFEPHQIEALKAAQEGHFVWKYSDQDQRQKPFDCSSIPPLPSYVVVRFGNVFYIIPVDSVIGEQGSGKKSLKRADAFRLCVKAVQM